MGDIDKRICDKGIEYTCRNDLECSRPYSTEIHDLEILSILRETLIFKEIVKVESNLIGPTLHISLWISVTQRLAGRGSFTKCGLRFHSLPS